MIVSVRLFCFVATGATDVLRRPTQFATLRDSCIACTQSSTTRAVALAAAGDASAFNPCADVLVIDSDEAARAAVQTALESIGYACTCVANYMHSAATLLSTAPYHLGMRCVLDVCFNRDCDLTSLWGFAARFAPQL